MQLSLGVQVVQPSRKLPRKDGDVLFFEDARFQLARQQASSPHLTRSAADPPSQNSIIIHSAEPLMYDPMYLPQRELALAHTG